MKTVVIGLDGATFDIIEPLVNAGRLPVLARLMREGASAPLRSTLLPNSFPGWASCTTGTSEGMHGVFSPFIKNQSKYSVRAMSGRDIMTRPIWDLVGEQGGRSLVVNVPTTYPPEPINGFMVTGMLTPSRASDFTYPVELKDDLLSKLPDYVIEPGRNPDKSARADEFRHAIDMHERALAYLIGREEWDFVMIVFSVLDRAQHDYWADMDPAHPRHDPKTPFRRFIHEVYERLDGAVGRIVEKQNGEARVLVVSDHGFCSELYEVRMNEVLADAGLLTFKSPGWRRSQARVREVKDKLGRRLFGAEATGNSLERKLQYGAAFLTEIDWSRTRAFFAQDKGIWINLAGREESGIVGEAGFDDVVEEARQAVCRLIAREDGEPVFERVMRREEAFTGAWSSRLPDLVMVPRRDEYVYNERPSYGEIIVPADSTTGTHSRDGILIAWGPGIAPATTFLSQPNLRDVGPTALASLGCPLTVDMDGRALTEVFDAVSAAVRSGSSYRQRDLKEAMAQDVYSAAEEAAVKERLRALGYIE